MLTETVVLLLRDRIEANIDSELGLDPAIFQGQAPHKRFFRSQQ